MKCNYCHKDGHGKWDCPQLKRKANRQSGRENKNYANLLDGYEPAEVLMVANRDCPEEWILDSGCTFHMTPLKHYFSEINEFDGGKVLWATISSV